MARAQEWSVPSGGPLRRQGVVLGCVVTVAAVLAGTALPGGSEGLAVGGLSGEAATIASLVALAFSMPLLMITASVGGSGARALARLRRTR